MNNMMYPYIQNDMMNLQYHYNKITELEQRINRVEREVARLSKKINNLEGKNVTPLTSTPNIDIKDSSNVYMV